MHFQEHWIARSRRLILCADRVQSTIIVITSRILFDIHFSGMYTPHDTDICMCWCNHAKSPRVPDTDTISLLPLHRVCSRVGACHRWAELPAWSWSSQQPPHPASTTTTTTTTTTSLPGDTSCSSEQQQLLQTCKLSLICPRGPEINLAKFAATTVYK